nr:hypothetical protein [Escherichia coli]
MALKLLANNNAKSVLAAGISASATVITVGTGAGSLFPSPVSGQSYFKLTITDAATKTISEIMHVTSVSGDVMTVIRGQEGTTARVWSTNDIVANLMTAGSLLSFLQISNNLSEIKDAGEDAVNEARYNLGISDSSGFVGRSLGAPKAFYANGTYTRSPLARYAKVTLTAPVVAVAAARPPTIQKPSPVPAAVRVRPLSYGLTCLLPVLTRLLSARVVRAELAQ